MFDYLLHTTTVSFPGLGIGEFTVDSVAIPGLFSRGIAWYGVIITFAILLSGWYGIKRGNYEGYTTDDMLDVILSAVICCVLGARTYYVIFYGNCRSFYDFISIWNGGLAIYGAVIAGILTLFTVAKIKKKSPLKLLDVGASSIILGQAIGRWGNFMNGEAYGYETTLPWRMGLGSGDAAIFVHPTFLYESLWNLLGFVLLAVFYKKKKYDGQIFLAYLAWYGFGRMLIEGLRTDSLWLVPNIIRVSQLLGALSFVVTAALLIIFGVIHRKKGSQDVHSA